MKPANEVPSPHVAGGAAGRPSRCGLRLTSFSVVLSATLALLCGPLLLDLASSPRRRAFGYVAADAFYYLTVARNIARHGIASYDGVHPTNGFHPLWQAVCGLVYFVAERLGLSAHVVLGLVLLELALIAAAVWFLALAFVANGAFGPSFVALPAGLYAVFVLPLWSSRCLSTQAADGWNVVVGRLPLFGTLWSYANGMESGLVLFWFGVLALRHARATSVPGVRAAATYGLVAALVALSRLDHTLLVLPLLVAYGLRTPASGRAALVTSFAFPITAYLAANRMFVGAAFPVSGALKSSFPYFSSENLQLLTGLFQNTTCSSLVVVAWREAQLCLPMFVSVLYLGATLKIAAVRGGLAVTFRGSTGRIDRFLVLVALGVVLLGSYDFLFVSIGAQGQWYFPVSTLFVTLAALAVFHRFTPRHRWVPPGAMVALVAASIGLFVGFRRSEEFNARLARFYWEEAPRVRARYGANPLRFVEFDDGIVSFALDAPAMSATLMMDPESARAKASARLFDLAIRRGFDRLTTLIYGSLDFAPYLAMPNGAGEWARRFAGSEDISRYDFEFDYVSSARDFAIVRFSRKSKLP